MIFALRTEAPLVQLVIMSDGGEVLRRDDWQADRRLAHELLGRIESLLNAESATWTDLTGLIVFKGPGSFTGLRIGVTVMNTISYAQGIPIVGVAGGQWMDDGVRRLQAGDNDMIVLPEYGGEAHITKPRK